MRGQALVALGVVAMWCVTAPAWVAAKAIDYVATIDVRPAEPGQDVAVLSAMCLKISTGMDGVRPTESLVSRGCWYLTVSMW